MFQVRVDRLKVRPVGRKLEEMLAKGDQRMRTARRGIDPANEFLSGSLNGGGKFREGLRTGRTFKIGGCPDNSSLIRRKIVAKHFKELATLVGLHLFVT